MEQLILTLAIFALAFVGMAIGVLVQGQRGELKGSCGGVGANPDCCMTCPDKPKCDAEAEAEEQLVALARAHAESDSALAQSPSGHTAVRPF
jgi:hypothetical protein